MVPALGLRTGQQEAGPQSEGRGALRVLLAGGQGGGNKGGGRLETSKEHPRNMLATCLLLWCDYGGTTVLPLPLGLLLSLAP